MLPEIKLVNIKDLAITSPTMKEAVALFDPKVDIPPEGWDFMFSEFRDLIPSFTVRSNPGLDDEISYFYDFAANLKLLVSDNKSRTPTITKENWELLQVALKRTKTNSEWGEYLKLASSSKLFLPERAREVVDLNDENWEDIQSYIVGERIKLKNPLAGDLFKFSKSLLGIKILDSQKYEEVSPPEAFWTMVLETCSTPHSSFDDLTAVFRIPAVLRLLEPRRFHSHTPGQTWWEEAKATFQRLPLAEPEDRDGSLYASIASSLAITAAKTVAITDKGIVLNGESDQTSAAFTTSPPLPRVRRF